MGLDSNFFTGTEYNYGGIMKIRQLRNISIIFLLFGQVILSGPSNADTVNYSDTEAPRFESLEVFPNTLDVGNSSGEFLFTLTLSDNLNNIGYCDTYLSPIIGPVMQAAGVGNPISVNIVNSRIITVLQFRIKVPKGVPESVKKVYIFCNDQAGNRLEGKLYGEVRITNNQPSSIIDVSQFDIAAQNLKLKETISNLNLEISNLKSIPNQPSSNSKELEITVANLKQLNMQLSISEKKLKNCLVAAKKIIATKKGKLPSDC